MNPLQIAMMFQAENVALQRKLALRTEEADRALQARKAMGSKVAEMKQQWSDKEEEKSELTTNMTRDKRMQDELLNRVNILENSITELKDQLEISKQEAARVADQKDKIIADKDAEIDLMKEKMDQMAQEFGDMLKETLDKMSSRIEISSSMLETEGAVAMQKKLEEFSL